MEHDKPLHGSRGKARNMSFISS